MLLRRQQPLLPTEGMTEMTTKWLNTAQVAEIIGVPKRTLEGWRQKGTGPAWKRFPNRAVMYRLDKLEEWTETLPSSEDKAA